MSKFEDLPADLIALKIFFLLDLCEMRRNIALVCKHFYKATKHNCLRKKYMNDMIANRDIVCAYHQVKTKKYFINRKSLLPSFLRSIECFDLTNHFHLKVALKIISHDIWLFYFFKEKLTEKNYDMINYFLDNCFIKREGNFHPKRTIAFESIDSYECNDILSMRKYDNLKGLLKFIPEKLRTPEICMKCFKIDQNSKFDLIPKKSMTLELYEFLISIDLNYLLKFEPLP
jgi:hypothetical protein